MRNHCPEAPTILVGGFMVALKKSNELWSYHFYAPAGTKVDARTGDSEPATVVTEKQGKAIRSKIKAANFIECSAKTNVGVEQAFQEAVRAAIKFRRDQARRQHCLFM